MSAAQTAFINDIQHRNISIGSRLVEQFTGNHPMGRNRRFLESPATSDPSSQATVGVQSNKAEDIGDAPLLWYEAKPQAGQAVSLQKWEGVVLNIEASANTFFARLHDLTADNPEEEAEFSIDEVMEDDKNLLMPGAVFYWSIGYHTSETGQQLRASVIKFRRLPAWRGKELKEIESKAREFGRAIGWGTEESAACAG